MHCERSLKATLRSGCLYVLGILLCSTTLPAAETGDAGLPSTAETKEEAVTLPEMTVTAAPGRGTAYRVPDAAVSIKTDTPITYDFNNYQALKGLRLGLGAFAVGSWREMQRTPLFYRVMCAWMPSRVIASMWVRRA